MAELAGAHVNRRTSRDPSRAWLFAALLLAVVATVALLFLPLITTETQHSGAEPIDQVETRTEQQRLVEQDGQAAAVVLAVPVLICAAPLLFRARWRRPATIVAATLLTAGTVLGAASVGLFYLPSAGLLIVAAVRAGNSRTASR